VRSVFDTLPHRISLEPVANSVLDEAVKRAKVADQLTGGDSGDDTDSEDAASAEEDLETAAAGGTEEPDTTEEEPATIEEGEPVPVAAERGFNPNAHTVSDYFGGQAPAAAPTPVPKAQPVTYPTITSEGAPYTPPAAASPRANAYLLEGESLTGEAPPISDQSILEQPNPNAQSVQDYWKAHGTLFSMGAEGYVSPTEEAAMAAQAKGQPRVERGELVGLPPEQGGFPVASAPADVRRAELVKMPSGQPAPDRLTQVERGELVKLPSGQPAPDRLTQVERGELVRLPPEQGGAPLAAQPPSQLTSSAALASARPGSGSSGLSVDRPSLFVGRKSAKQS